MKSSRFFFVLFISAVLFLLAAGLAFAQDPAAISGEKCKGCHGDIHTEWASTRHAVALKTLVDSGHAQDFCLACHSTDYILAPQGSKPTVQTAQYSLTCLACHPGDHTAGGSAKIENVFDTCAKCHNGTSGGTRPILPGSEAHHPMKEMFMGEGAPEVSGVPSPHLPVKDCTNCHVEGHKYEATQAACDKCHGGKKTIEAIHKEVLPKLETLKTVLDQIKAAHPDWDPQAQTKGDEQKAYELAYTLYTFAASEGSGGVHNYDYTYAILAKAKDALVKVGLAAPEALPITGAELVNLWPYLAGLAGAALVGVGVRKRMK